jgi:hypothetical protein
LSLIRSSKHPLVVLLAATLLGSVLIPYVNARIDREKRRRELKSERATQILRSARDIERKLNLVFTEFENFYKDQVATGDITKPSTVAFRGQVYKLYEDFNRDAWWWHWQIQEEAEVLGLIDGESLAQLKRSVEAYNTSLVSSTREVDRVWAALLRTPRSERPETTARLISDVTDHLRLNSNHRQKFVRGMVDAILRNP